MKIIKCLSEYILEEIEDADKYAQKALKIKGEYPEIAELLNTLSNEEIKHMQMLHNMIEKVIENYRKTNGNPPAPMQAVYDYLHEQAIEKAKDVKILQQMYMEK